MPTILNPDGNDVLIGSALNDRVDLSPPTPPDLHLYFYPNLGAGDNDLIQTGAGDDVIQFGPGHDTIDGGDGQDAVVTTYFDAAKHGLEGLVSEGSTSYVTYSFFIHDILVDLGAETYSINAIGINRFLPQEHLTLTGEIRNVEVLTGTYGDDTLLGSDREDAVEVFNFSPGFDVIDGRGGRDRIDLTSSFFSGSATVDLAAGTLLKDGVAVASLAGIEDVMGSWQDDRIIGSKEDNEITGYAGSDTILAGKGDDRVIIDYGIDTVTLGQGADTIVIQNGRCIVTDFRFLTDRLELPESAAAAEAGLGAEAAAEEERPLVQLVQAERYAKDLTVILSGSQRVTLTDGVRHLAKDIVGAIEDTAASVQAVTTRGGSASGTGKADLILGSEGKNHLSGGGAGDTIMGSNGNDEIVGGRGNDTLSGGDGWDVIRSGGGSDVMYGGAGSDTLVVTQGSPAKGSVLDGGSGNDGLFGGSGADIYVVSDEQAVGGGPDRIFLMGKGDRIDLTGFDLSRSEQKPSDWRIVRYHEDRQSNEIYQVFLPGNDGRGPENADFLLSFNRDFKSVADKFAVLREAGTYIHKDGPNNAAEGGSRADRLAGLAGADMLEGRGGADRLDGRQGDDILQGGAGADVLLGGAGNDLLSGDLGDDTLDGGEGDDTLVGGAGSDRMTGGVGKDTFVFTVNDIVAIPKEDGSVRRTLDIINDFEFGVDKIALPEGYAGDSLFLRVEPDAITIAESEDKYFQNGPFLKIYLENAAEHILTLQDLL